MFENLLIYVISFLCFLLIISLFAFLNELVLGKRNKVKERLQGFNFSRIKDEEDILTRPFMERTFGAMASWMAKNVSNTTPEKISKIIDLKLERAGRPKNLKASDLIILIVIIGTTSFIICFYILSILQLSLLKMILLTLPVSLLGMYIPWFVIARIETARIREIKKSLPDIMDLLVVSVEAGLSFDMALMKVVEKYKGSVAQEFQKVLKDVQLGKTRKEAFKDMLERVRVEDLSSLVNAIVQSEQLGVGLGNILRLQADLMREKRQQWVEEQAMKAPIKMLFPLVFCMFPAMFIVILGPALISLVKALKGL